MLSPPSFQRGEELTAPGFRQKLQRLADCIRERTPQQGANTRLTTGPTGFAISATPARPGGGAPEPYRFKILDASTTSGEVTTAKVSFAPGTIDDLSPVIGSTTLDTVPRPALELSNDVKNIIVLKATYTADTATTDGYTYLLPNGTLSDPEILAYEDGEVPGDVDPTAEAPAGTCYVRIGFADVDADGKITALENDGLRSSLVSHYCPGSPVWFSTI